MAEIRLYRHWMSTDKSWHISEFQENYILGFSNVYNLPIVSFHNCIPPKEPGKIEMFTFFSEPLLNNVLELWPEDKIICSQCMKNMEYWRPSQYAKIFR